MIDGPCPETKELLGSFWIIQVKSKVEAIERMIILYPDYASEVHMADFTHYQDVVLLRDISEEGLCADDVGAGKV